MATMTSEWSARARDVMEAKIARGRASAADLIEHIQEAVPSDAVVAGRLLHFEGGAEPLRVVWHDRRAGQDVANRVHRHALGQLAAKAGVPSGFLVELDASPEPWRRELAAEILNRHFHEGREDRREDASAKRYLTRSIGGEMRGFLSDKYRRIDSRPTLDAFLGECLAVGAQPFEGVVTDTRVSLRALLPVVHEPVPGEVLCFGAEWGNSDFGAAKHWMRSFILRLACTNGATLDDVLAQVHSGARLSDDYEYSERTMQLDTEANVSALRDVVRGTLGPAQVERNLGMIRQAHEQKVDWKSRQGSLAARLTKGELKLVKDAFEGEDVINLPAGRTAWRMSNALSWIANGEAVAPERRIDLQRMAGEMAGGRRDAAVSDEG